jgi:hypothetical protein
MLLPFGRFSPVEPSAQTGKAAVLRYLGSFLGEAVFRMIFYVVTRPACLCTHHSTGQLLSQLSSNPLVGLFDEFAKTT